MLETTPEVIDELGGNRPVADMFGLTDKAVSNWRSGNRFPPHTFVRLNDELKARGLEASSALWRFERSPKSTSKRGAA